MAEKIVRTVASETVKLCISTLVAFITLTNFFVTSKEFQQYEKIGVAQVVAQEKQNEDIKSWLTRVETKLDKVIVTAKSASIAPLTRKSGLVLGELTKTDSEYVVLVSGSTFSPQTGAPRDL